jgi:arginase family enzyme
MRSRFSLDSGIEDIAAFYGRIRAAGVRPLSVGGDHSITYPILKALGQDRPVGLVHIDTMGEIDGSRASGQSALSKGRSLGHILLQSSIETTKCQVFYGANNLCSATNMRTMPQSDPEAHETAGQ